MNWQHKSPSKACTSLSNCKPLPLRCVDELFYRYFHLLGPKLQDLHVINVICFCQPTPPSVPCPGRAVLCAQSPVPAQHQLTTHMGAKHLCAGPCTSKFSSFTRQEEPASVPSLPRFTRKHKNPFQRIRENVIQKGRGTERLSNGKVPGEKPFPGLQGSPAWHGTGWRQGLVLPAQAPAVGDHRHDDVLQPHAPRPGRFFTW